MKISNSKQELARIISENSGWLNGEFAAQDGDGGVGGHAVKPEWNSLAKYWWRGAWGEWFLANKIKNHHQTVLSRAEYFHLYPATDADGWIEWNGGDCPVGEGDRIDVKFSDGDEFFDVGSDWDWGLHADGCNIIAYRLHKRDAVKPTDFGAVGDDETNLSSKEELETMEYKPSIEQLMQTYTDRAHSVQLANKHLATCTEQANETMEALSVACKAVGFDISPITAKQAPELVITDWRDLQVGDIIEYVDGRNKNRVGMVGRVDRFDLYNADTDRPVRMASDDGQVGWPTKWRFIRRP